MEIGCGPRFAAFKLTEWFKNVLGTDLSEPMLEECNLLKEQFLTTAEPETVCKSISFMKVSGEKAPEFVAPNSVDLITAAEYVHWMDVPKLFEKSAHVLKPQGTLCYWHYIDPVFIDRKEATEIHMRYSYGSSRDEDPSGHERYLGPYFENPGHDKYRNGRKDFPPTPEFFEHVIRHEFDPTKDNPASTPLYIEKEFSLHAYDELLCSYCGYFTWKKANPDKPDVMDCLVAELVAIFGSEYDKPIRVVFPTVYTLACKK